MKATGIIVEYNPFHNGHKLHAAAAKLESNADVVIAVMSGNFLQRGEPALIDKWARTEMALKNGVDIVFELPYNFATAHAPTFSKGAIGLLDAARCDSYCFGSEEGAIQPFSNSMTLIYEQRAAYEQAIKEAILQGESYPKALNTAYRIAIAEQQATQNFADLTKPNNILGFHYMQAAKEMHSTMTATTIQRVGADYHDEQLRNNTIASATAIRKSFFTTSQLNDIQHYVPPTVQQLLNERLAASHSFNNWTTFYPFLRMTILRDGPAQLAKIADVTEGIENLFYRAALKHESFEGFMQMVKSKRYTWTRIQRMLTHIFTGYTYDKRASIQEPTYLRLLGMTQIGRLYLNDKKKDLKLPMISKVAASSDASLAIDIHATNMYALGSQENDMINADFKRAPIYIKSSSKKG